LRKIERKYDRELAVVGVHSPKFISERDTEAVRHAILRLNVGHPVVNDREFTVWQSFAVRAWPTLMFIDPEGKVIGKHEGEFELQQFDQLIGAMVAEFEAAGTLDRRPLELSLDQHESTSGLRFPGKVLADESRDLLAIADSGHNRIVLADLDGRVRRIVGAGGEGMADGDASTATFYQPQGMALDGDLLYVADTENHALRVIDVTSGRVATLAGTGEQLMGNRVGGPLLTTRLSSPWDLAILDGTLYVAMAGIHQLWAHQLGTSTIEPHTGNGREALVDEIRRYAAMNQPSGLTHDGQRLFVADSEASAIRSVELEGAGYVKTIIGEGLFEFGDQDGVGPANVRLQHPLGVLHVDGRLYIADTYNHKVKWLDPATAETRSLAGTGEPGLVDGAPGAARFSEPSGLAYAGGRLYVADTNNHAIRTVDRATGHVGTLAIGV
jgi:DNA-binding beta-propeller fold protein YncE